MPLVFGYTLTGGRRTEIVAEPRRPGRADSENAFVTSPRLAANFWVIVAIGRRCPGPHTMNRLSLLSLAAALSAPLMLGMTATAQPVPVRKLAVVELFTSQGCSSCPPANANVAALSNRPDVIALSFGVTYWDKLGWKDTFASQAYTAHQYAYARALNHDAPFTPQVVVDGKADVVGAQAGEIDALIAREQIVGPELTVASGAVEIGAGRGPANGPADVWLVRYDPRVVQVPIRAGENNGRTLPHKNVVRELTRLGDWTGRPAHFALPTAPAGLSTAILVQTKAAGPILAAARG